MKIARLTSDKQITNNAFISSKNIDTGFAQEFGTASKQEQDRYMNKLLDKIKKKGRQIIQTKSPAAVHEYKDHIKEYLSLVLKDAYRVQRIHSSFGSPATLVAIINKELNELAQTILVQEKDTITIANMIDNIEGLLIDTYR